MAELLRADLADDPLEQFRRWFEEARPVVRLPEAMAVATAAPDGGPSVRMLLLKAADERGFVFFTGYVSRKGAELDANPRAALLFYWDPLGRQVRVEGTVQRVPAAESDEYFATRPQGSRLGAAASRQSAVVLEPQSNRAVTGCRLRRVVSVSNPGFLDAHHRPCGIREQEGAPA